MKKLAFAMCFIFLAAVFTSQVWAAEGTQQPAQMEKGYSQPAPMTQPAGTQGTAPMIKGSAPLEQNTNAMQQGKAEAGGMMETSFHTRGMKVQSAKGQNIGSVRDVIIGSNGDVQYLIIAHGGTFGFGEKLSPVPWSAVTGNVNGALIVNFNKERLAKAPTISEGEYKDFSSPTWNHKVHAYYEQGGESGQVQKNMPATGMQPEAQGMNKEHKTAY